jgi:tRNA dimethylallyltransferase
MRLAQMHPEVEIISMDSAQVYRGMDIGTAKPTRQEQAQVRHHLIDIIEPNVSYSAARFVHDAFAAAADIRRRGGTPIIVGGTMLYYKAAMEGLDDLPSAPAELRASIAHEAAERGWPAMHETLMAVDPSTAARLAPNDAQRISRALELYRATGQAMSALIAQSGQRHRAGEGGREPLVAIALEPQDRALLHQRIDQRFRAMVSAGLLDEVRQLMARGDLHATLPSMRCVGYRQAWEHLSGETSMDAFMAKGIAATRQLAKRQITWLRSFSDVLRVDPLHEDAAFALCEHQLTRA